MKTQFFKSTLVLASLLLSISSFSQTSNPPNPGVRNPDVQPIDGNGILTVSENISVYFRVVNTNGGEAQPNSASKIKITLFKLAPSENFDFNTDIVSIDNYYTWTYNPVNKTFTGVLTTAIPAFPGGASEFQIKNLITTGLSGLPHTAGPENGFSAKIEAPGAINSMTGNDDFISEFAKSNTISTITPLPINLSSFTVQNTDCNSSLSWTTFTELSSKHFVVEASTDGKSYTEIGRVDAAGNSDVKQSYQFSHIMKENTPYFYRLKMVDQDNTFKYSKVEGASCKMNNPALITASPNPTTSEVKIAGLNNGSYTISVIDVTGRQLAQSTSADASSTTINLSKFPDGLYTVRVQDAEGVITNLKVSKL